jgi:hypothetical protein
MKFTIFYFNPKTFEFIFKTVTLLIFQFLCNIVLYIFCLGLERI